MKRIVEIKSMELLSCGSELTDTIQAYVKGAVTLLNIGRAHTRRFIMSDKRQILIHHTDKSVIVEKC